MGACTFARAAGSFADQAEFSMAAPSGNGDMYRGVKGVLTFSGSYANPAGDTIPLASVGLVEIREILVDPTVTTAAQGGLSVLLAGTPAAPTVRLFLAAGGVGAGAGTEVVNAAVVSSHAVNVILLGH